MRRSAAGAGPRSRRARHAGSVLFGAGHTAFIVACLRTRLGFGAGGVTLFWCIGPWRTGEVSDRSYGMARGLLLSGGILAGAAAIALLQREPRRPISAD